MDAETLAGAMTVRLFDLAEIRVDERNARTHSDAQIGQLAGSMRRFGWTIPMLIDVERGQLIVAGHGRRAAALALFDQGETVKLPGGHVLPIGKVPGIDVSGWTDEERRAYALADNQLALQAGWDDDILRQEIEAAQSAGIDLIDLGFDADAMAALELAAMNEAEGKDRGTANPGQLAAEFMIPPFSVLSAREGWWQDRKRQWLALGIASEVGRGGNLIGRSLHEMVAMSMSSGTGVGKHYQAAKDFIDKHRAEGLTDSDILIKAQGGAASAFGSGSASGGGRRLGESTADRMFRQTAEGKVHEAIPGGAGKNSVYRDSGKAMRERPPGLGGVTMTSLSSHPRYYEQKTAAERRIGRALTPEEFERDHWVMPDSELNSGTSIFDPVLCEIAYRWWSAPGQLVLDPFAGGSVRGIVAAALGRRYVGVDLRPEQCAANRDQWADIGPKLGVPPEEGSEPPPPLPEPIWHEGDSRKKVKALKIKPDFLFSCPPYGDLEVYSDDPADLSTLDADQFDKDYAEIIGKSVACLADDRFACFIVGDYRDKRGLYRNFVSKTIAAFEAAGARLYNEAILVTSAGSLAIRAGKQFRSTRKLGKTHQNILVFVKGDPRKATEALGPVDVSAALAAVEAEVEDAQLMAELTGDSAPAEPGQDDHAGFSVDLGGEVR